MQETAASRAWRAQKLLQDREVEQADQDAAVDRFQRNASLISELTDFNSIHGSQAAQSDLCPDVTAVAPELGGDRAGGGLSQERKKGGGKRRSSQYAADCHHSAKEPRTGSESQINLTWKRGHSGPTADIIESRKRMATFEDKLGRLGFPTTADGNELLLDRKPEPLAAGPLMMSAESGRPLIERLEITSTSLENALSDRTTNGKGGGSCRDVLLPHGVTYIKPQPESVPEVRTVDGNQHVIGAQDVESWCSLMECVPLYEGSVHRSCQWIATSLRIIQEL